MSNNNVTYLSDDDIIIENGEDDFVLVKNNELKGELKDLQKRLRIINKIQKKREENQTTSNVKNSFYIELDSSFRDRKLHKNPSEFTIKVSELGTSSDSTVAINPITNAYPYYNFQGCHQLFYLPRLLMDFFQVELLCHLS